MMDRWKQCLNYLLKALLLPSRSRKALGDQDAGSWVWPGSLGNLQSHSGQTKGRGSSLQVQTTLSLRQLEPLGCDPAGDGLQSLGYRQTPETWRTRAPCLPWDDPAHRSGGDPSRDGPGSRAGSGGTNQARWPSEPHNQLDAGITQCPAPQTGGTQSVSQTLTISTSAPRGPTTRTAS